MMSRTTDDFPLRVTERFPLPDRRVGVSTWSAADPEQLEQQLRTRAGHPHPDREPARRLHRSHPPMLTIEDWRSGSPRPIDPLQESRRDPRWSTALARSRRPGWLRRIVGPRDLPGTAAPEALARWTECDDSAEATP